jgi:hypothetical protein
MFVVVKMVLKHGQRRSLELKERSTRVKRKRPNHPTFLFCKTQQMVEWKHNFPVDIDAVCDVQSHQMLPFLFFVWRFCLDAPCFFAKAAAAGSSCGGLWGVCAVESRGDNDTVVGTGVLTASGVISLCCQTRL